MSTSPPTPRDMTACRPRVPAELRPVSPVHDGLVAGPGIVAEVLRRG
ncbi:hypothetical protein [Streptomyces griseoluteus]